jgi:hypothetical protein
MTGEGQHVWRWPIMGRIGVERLVGPAATSPCGESWQTSLWCWRTRTVRRKKSRNVSRAQRSCWCGFRRFRCWLSRSNVQVVRKANAGDRVPV